VNNLAEVVTAKNYSYKLSVPQPLGHHNKYFKFFIQSSKPFNDNSSTEHKLQQKAGILL